MTTWQYNLMFGLMGQDGADSRGLFMYVSALKHITDGNNPRSDFKTSSARWFLYSTRRDLVRPRLMYEGHVPLLGSRGFAQSHQ